VLNKYQGFTWQRNKKSPVETGDGLRLLAI